MIKARELYEEEEGGDMALDWTETDDDMLWTRSLVKQVLRLPWSSIVMSIGQLQIFLFNAEKFGMFRWPH